MSKKILLLIIAFCYMIALPAQTLFTFGAHSVDAKDFLRAYTKNNTGPVTNKAKAINDYLTLYINSRLKIQEAYDRSFDTLPQIRDEVANLRAQIVENFMSDPAAVKRLSKEAFQRSLKNINTAHIFISFKNQSGVIDTAAANKKKNEILKRLQKGDDFLLVAQQNSDDPAAKDNKGELGYIAVFTLPYEFENIIYSTPVGKYSAPFRSNAGYHIFKNLGERKAPGKMKAQQILIALPPGSNESTKNELKKLADSLYKRVIAGDDFSKLAFKFSNDYITAPNSGIIQEIEPGRYDQTFENELWALSKDGAISKPFFTSHGWHILKRMSLTPAVTDPANDANQKELQQKITLDGRWKGSTQFIYDLVEKKAGFNKMYTDAVLWALTDSLLDGKPAGIGKSMNMESLLFKIGDTTINVNAWITYAQSHRFIPDVGNKSNQALMSEFIRSVMYNYYHDNLENFNAEFRNQMNEFREGNLFFEIMQQEIWNKSQNDSMALLSLYEKNKKNYTWKQSADAIVFFCSDEETAKKIFNQLKRSPADWRKITEAESERVVADSTRYEWEQIPNLNKMKPTPGMITNVLVNKGDKTASFAYIINVYPTPMQRSYTEAKGLVINDYQAVLEEQWIAELKKKYPVVVDEKVLASISK
ncbi:MAG: peptidylprolyl isomerase [Bacteroidota bacterium]